MDSINFVKTLSFSLSLRKNTSSQFYHPGNGGFAISIELPGQSSQISGLLFFSGEIINCLIELNRFIGFLGTHAQSHNENQYLSV